MRFVIGAVALAATQAQAQEAEHVSCYVADWRTGAEYDLTPLGADGAATFTDLENNVFHVNPCRYLSPWTSDARELTKCLEDKDQPGVSQTAVYGCQYDHANGQVYDIGSKVVSDAILPQATCDGMPQVLTLELSDGDSYLCPEIAQGDGTVTKKRDTEIHFICTHKEERFEVLEDKSTDHECSYSVNWYTPAACPIAPTPVKESSTACSVTTAEGQIIDLSPLRKTVGNYIVNVPDHKRNTEYEYVFNVCQPITGNVEKWHANVQQGCGGDAAACQLEFMEDTIRAWNTGRIMEDGHNPTALEVDEDTGVPFLKYTGGDKCAENFRTTEIRFLCEEDAGVGVPFFVTESVDEETECTYLFEWRTQYACPHNPSSSPLTNAGTVVAILFLVVIPSLVALYCIGGCIYNRTQKGARGTDQIPHIEVLSAVFGATCGRVCGGGADAGLSIRAEDGEAEASLMDSEYE